MADHINFSVSATPIEELTEEQGGTTKIVASEVATPLGGSGDSIGISNYSGALNAQGYKDGAVGYLDAVHAAGGVQLSQRNQGDFLFIRNTGFKYSTATEVGLATTDCVLVTVRVEAWETAAKAGWVRGNDAGAIHYIEIAWLKPGQAIVLPLAVNNLAITQFGSVADDLTSLEQESGSEAEVCRVYVRTFESDGSIASDGNAVEFLSVD